MIGSSQTAWLQLPRDVHQRVVRAARSWPGIHRVHGHDRRQRRRSNPRDSRPRSRRSGASATSRRCWGCATSTPWSTKRRRWSVARMRPCAIAQASSSTVYADASARWTPTEALTVRLGIDNLTDVDPKLYTPDQDSGTNPSVYDVDRAALVPERYLPLLASRGIRKMGAAARAAALFLRTATYPRSRLRPHFDLPDLVVVEREPALQDLGARRTALRRSTPRLRASCHPSSRGSNAPCP